MKGGKSQEQRKEWRDGEKQLGGHRRGNADGNGFAADKVLRPRVPAARHCHIRRRAKDREVLTGAGFMRQSSERENRYEACRRSRRQSSIFERGGRRGFYFGQGQAEPAGGAREVILNTGNWNCVSGRRIALGN